MYIIVCVFETLPQSYNGPILRKFRTHTERTKTVIFQLSVNENPLYGVHRFSKSSFRKMLTVLKSNISRSSENINSTHKHFTPVKPAII